MKHLVFFVSILPSFNFSKQFVAYHLDLKKYPKNIPNYNFTCQRLGMILVMKKNSINQKTYIRMFTKSNIEVLEKKTKYLQKHFTYFQVIEFYFSNCHKL
jgi:hypothetical protein